MEKEPLVPLQNKGQLISKHQKSPIYRLYSRHSNLIKPGVGLCFLSFFFSCFLEKKRKTCSISDITADSVCLRKKKKKNLLCFLLYPNSKRFTSLVSMEPRDCTVRGKFNEKTVHTTSLSLTVNYLGIRYRLPTRRNSTQQTDRGASRGGRDGERWKSAEVESGESSHDKGRREVAPSGDGDFQLRSKVIGCHLKINLSRHRFPFFQRQSPEPIKTFSTNSDAGGSRLAEVFKGHRFGKFMEGAKTLF